jgi:cysteine desulfurase / selenocysteine lyase
VHGKLLIYLDNAATSQKPKCVIDALTRFYLMDNANIHRGVHQLSERSTQSYEAARGKVQRFLNAARAREIIFVRGATEGINLVAQTYGRKYVGAGDEIVISAMEHHSNIVPWQMLCEEKGAVLRVIPINNRGEVEFDQFEKLLSHRTRLVAVSHVSNALGTINPVREIINAAHSWNVPVLIDGAQAVPHMKVDVRNLDCDFYVFSGHKVFGPTGIGVLYGREQLLEDMPPWQGGGDMILEVTFAKTTFQEPPHRFEAGTPDISGAVGLGIALDYLETLGRDAILEHEEALTGYGVDRLSAMPGVHLVGAGQRRLAILSVHVDGIHPHDLATVLDQHNVAIRAGHHCAQPLLDKLGLAATARASLGIYNDESDVDALADAIKAAQTMFKAAK